jgi:hypothetical protein
MKRILSISLGSSTRDKAFQATLLGQDVLLERRGCDGSLGRFRQTVQEEDGKVDIITFGGIPMALVALGCKYYFRDAVRMCRLARNTPVMDGELFREWIEPDFIERLSKQGVIDPSQRVLFPLVTNRMRMAERLVQLGFTQIAYGDLVFDLGLPWPLVRKLKTMDRLTRAVAPLITRLPYRWLYPIGAKQEEIKERRPDLFAQADILAGDFHNIRRYLIPDLAGKTLLTNTVTKADRDLLKKRGLKQLVTFSPNFDGRTFGSNLLGGTMAALLGKAPEEITHEEYMDLAARMGLAPVVETLN